jgi:hypothetical protein
MFLFPLLSSSPASQGGGFMVGWTLEQQANLRKTGILMIEHMQHLQNEVSVLHKQLDHLERALVDKGLLRQEEISAGRHKEFLEESFMRIMTDLKVTALKTGFLQLLDGVPDASEQEGDLLLSDTPPSRCST